MQELCGASRKGKGKEVTDALEELEGKGGEEGDDEDKDGVLIRDADAPNAYSHERFYILAIPCSIPSYHFAFSYFCTHACITFINGLILHCLNKAKACHTQVHPQTL